MAIGLASGVAQLGSLSRGLGRILLEIVCIGCVLFLVIRIWHAYFVMANRRLRQELQQANGRLGDHRAGHRRYLDAIERIIDRETPLFQDTLEVTVVIGGDDTSDMIMERWHTVPQPRVTHRSMRPIVPTDEERIVTLDEIGLKCELINVPGSITQLPLVEGIHYLRVWLVFDPALTEPVDWTAEYRPKGLWRPLRERGWDHLGWDDRLPNASGALSSLRHFRVRFVFPRSEKAPGVTERRGWGTFAQPRRIDGTGQWEIVWQDPQPAGRRYDWDLFQNRADMP